MSDHEAILSVFLLFFFCFSTVAGIYTFDASIWQHRKNQFEKMT